MTYLESIRASSPSTPIIAFGSFASTTWKYQLTLSSGRLRTELAIGQMRMTSRKDSHIDYHNEGNTRPLLHTPSYLSGRPSCTMAISSLKSHSCKQPSLYTTSTAIGLTNLLAHECHLDRFSQFVRLRFSMTVGALTISCSPAQIGIVPDLNGVLLHPPHPRPRCSCKAGQTHIKPLLATWRPNRHLRIQDVFTGHVSSITLQHGRTTTLT